MNFGEFDGQQSGERILSVLKPNHLPIATKTILLAVALLFFYVILLSIKQFIPDFPNSILSLITFIFLFILAISVTWSTMVYKKGLTYLTDRRIIRFEPISPFFISKRALFWTEALKAKAFQTNMIWRMMKIGAIEVESHAHPGESVKVTDLYLYEDIANYIDKIIFIIKSNPGDMKLLKPFVPKPKGQRG